MLARGCSVIPVIPCASIKADPHLSSTAKSIFAQFQLELSRSLGLAVRASRDGANVNCGAVEHYSSAQYSYDSVYCTKYSPFMLTWAFICVHSAVVYDFSFEFCSKCEVACGHFAWLPRTTPRETEFVRARHVLLRGHVFRFHNSVSRVGVLSSSCRSSVAGCKSCPCPLCRVQLWLPVLREQAPRHVTPISLLNLFL